MIEKRLFTIEEASIYLGFKRSTLYEWAGRQKIPVVRSGQKHGPIRFDKRDLDRWIEEHKDNGDFS